MSKTFTSRPSVMSNNRGRGRGQTEPSNRGRGRATTTGPSPGATTRVSRPGGSQPSVGGQTSSSRITRPGGSQPSVGGQTSSSRITRPGVTQPSVGGQTPSSRITRQEGSQQIPGDQSTSLQTAGHQPLTQRMSHQGAFTVVSPDEKKRQTIAQNAKMESDNYDAYKQKQKLTHVSYVGTVGGDTLEHESRQRAVDSQRTTKLNRLEKQQQYRDSKKKAEDSVINEKRTQQRQKADLNKRRDELTSAKQRERWDEDRKRKNDVFLRQFEKKGSSSGASNRKPQDEDLRNQPVIGQEPVYHDKFESHDRELPPHRTQQSSEDSDFAMGATGGSSQDQTNVDLQQLIKMFPQYETNILKDILQQTGSVENAAALLLN